MNIIWMGVELTLMRLKEEEEEGKGSGREMEGRWVASGLYQDKT